MNISSNVWGEVALADDLPVRRFALRVVSELAKVNVSRASAPVPDLTFVLMRYALCGDPALLAKLYAELVRRHVAAEEIMDIYMPLVVNRIGADWHDDKLDILHASMAFARLQSVLRELGKAWMSDRAGRATDGRILLMLPRGEQHTLGAMFAANQLRRIGVSVKVMLTSPQPDLSELFSRNRFHGIFISASNQTSLQPCADLVRELRAIDPRNTMIVLGGGLVSSEINDNDLSRIAAVTGADIVTNDISCALHACGIQRISAAAE